MQHPTRYGSSSIGSFDAEISNGLMRCRVFWARVISSESESLFTQNTKHTFYEIQYALRGRIGMILRDRERVTFDESDFIVIPPDTYHQIVDGDTEGERFIMAFTLDFLHPSLQGAARELLSALPHRETPLMRDLISLMLKKNYGVNSLRKQQLKVLLESFLTEVLEALSDLGTQPEIPGTARENAKRTVAEIKEFVHSRGGIGVQVKDLSEKFNLSQRHINRLFVSVMGESPREVINHEKLKRIEALVSTTALSLGEISELCGFSDEYAMNKFFKRYNRTNLSEFRAIGGKRAGKRDT